MKKVQYIVLAILIVSCGTNSFKTPNGTQVDYIRKGDGGAFKDSLISFYSFKYFTENGEEIFNTQEPIPVRVGGAYSEGKGELFQIFPMLNIGDSVHFKIEASDLFGKTFQIPLPDSIKAESKIAFQATLVKQQTDDEYYESAALDQKERLEQLIDSTQLANDRNILADFYVKNKIEDIILTKNGIGIRIIEDGAGLKPKLGQVVKVNYSGYLLNGDYFDSSVKEVAMEKGLYNEQREPYQPYSFQIYLSQVILGWHEGIAELKEGTKATLYIPSSLGYGPKKRSEIIIENSILVFDVELVEVVKK